MSRDDLATKRVTGRGFVVGVGVAMTLGDLLNTDQLILVVCDDCGVKTPIDPAPHALRIGLGADLARLSHAVRCPSCGSAELALKAHSPVVHRSESPALAK
jgi:hypothetical protein